MLFNMLTILGCLWFRRYLSRLNALEERKEMERGDGERGYRYML
jgi:hypothetical protein